MILGSDKMLTAGVFAKKAGISLRTIQYYDRIGVLKPASHTAAGQRLYNDNDFEKLQRILMMKFLGFSLDEIRKFLQMDSAGNFIERLDSQKSALADRVESIKGIIDTIERVKNGLATREQIQWEYFIDIINSLRMDTVLKEQYRNSEKLQARIRLHQKFSTGKVGWYTWLYDQMKIQKGGSILEIGCGDASFWYANLYRLPDDCRIILTDKSEGMLNDAKRKLENDSHSFGYKRMSAEYIDFEDNSFDIVIANHVLFYVNDRKKAFSEIRRVLKPGGRFIASTIGNNHMKELNEMTAEFSDGFVMAERMPQEDFGLQNGRGQLMEFFDEVEMYVHEDSLVVTDAASIMDYVMSTQGNAPEVLKGKKYNEFFKMLDDRIKQNHCIHISKESGIFISTK